MYQEGNICTTHLSLLSFCAASLYRWSFAQREVGLEMRELLPNERIKLMLMHCQRRLMDGDKLEDGWSQSLFISMSPSQCYLSSCHHCH